MTASSFDLPPLDLKAGVAARARQDSLTKPRGSLGALEDIACRLAAIQGTPRPAIRQMWVVVAAGDHGVVAEGVSPFPQEVTAQMVANFLAGGAAISVLARHAGAQIAIVNAGVKADIPGDTSSVIATSAPRGTKNMALGPAMSRPAAVRLTQEGAALARQLSVKGADIIATGDMGIGNTTAAAALTSVFTGLPPAEVTGRGTGLGDAGLKRKVAVIERAIAVNRPDAQDAVDAVSKVGGCEIAFLAGLMLGAAERRVAVALDGFISTSAALVAHGINPRVTDFIFACHMSAEPGHRAALERLQLKPLLDLGMRLGEGTGAALGLNLIEAAVKLHNEMATFGEAAVSDRPDGGQQASRKVPARSKMPSPSPSPEGRGGKAR